ncbi:MAG: Asd/ArgC dimerization domain-containing protein, partial [Candidatus Methanoperedens sp.]|nr:Asd/ArgC dimerization domain-containing protein [Candidatus Methanoperedens sp.]
ASAGLIERVVFDSKSGISGAGVEPSAVSHYPNMAENIQAYKLTTHRHRAEIVQELTRLDGSLKSISFTPHVIPSVRGILTTAHIFVKKQLSQEDVSAIYNDFYNDKPFIRLIKGIPMLGNVRGSNFCDIGFEVEKGSDRIVAISAIDNLVKGASGQAIQNMNLMSGLPETTGLWSPGFAP